MAVVAVSASFGALGGAICPQVALRLDVPFVDRGLSHRVASLLEVSVEEADHQWEPPARPFLERMLTNFRGVDAGVPVGPPPDLNSPDDFRRAAEAAVLEQAATGEGVILGRGAVGALRCREEVLRVRLSAPRERRIAQAMEFGEIDRASARAALDRVDRYQATYMREYYELDLDDPSLYHLVLDTSAFGVDACADLIAIAARALV